MSKINVAEFLPSAFSNEQAEILKEKISDALKEDDKVIIDFAGITKFTTLFFNFSTGFFVSTLGKEKYDKIFDVINLNELGDSTYTHSYNNCIRDEIGKAEEIQSKIMDIIKSTDDI